MVGGGGKGRRMGRKREGEVTGEGKMGEERTNDETGEGREGKVKGE